MARNIDLSEDLVPIGEFKTRPAKYLKQLAETGRPVVVTRHGRAAGVFLSPADYERLTERERFLKGVREGLADARAGRVISNDELGRQFQQKYAGGELHEDRVDYQGKKRSVRHRGSHRG